MPQRNIASAGDIGRRIQKRLEELDMEQKDLAKKVGVSTPSSRGSSTASRG